MNRQFPEHLKAHWKVYKESRNEKNSIEQNYIAYKTIQSLLKPQAGSVPPILTAEPLSLAASVTSPPQPLVASASQLTGWHIHHVLGQHNLARSTAQYYSCGHLKAATLYSLEFCSKRANSFSLLTQVSKLCNISKSQEKGLFVSNLGRKNNKYA